MQELLKENLNDESNKIPIWENDQSRQETIRIYQETKDPILPTYIRLLDATTATLMMPLRQRIVERAVIRIKRHERMQRKGR